MAGNFNQEFQVYNFHFPNWECLNQCLLWCWLYVDYSTVNLGMKTQSKLLILPHLRPGETFSQILLREMLLPGYWANTLFSLPRSYVICWSSSVLYKILYLKPLCSAKDASLCWGFLLNDGRTFGFSVNNCSKFIFKSSSLFLRRFGFL